MKKKCYYIMLAVKFPGYHPRAGQATNFVEKFKSGEKIHTIRGNLEEWKRKAEEINKGNAYLSVRRWVGIPFRSKQIEIDRLEKIGVEPVELAYFDYGDSDTPILDLAYNDGLLGDDFVNWFKGCSAELQAIIHFTDFRYNE